MLYFLDTFLWNGLMDINRGNRKKARGLRSVALHENTGGRSDQQTSEGTNKENLETMNTIKRRKLVSYEHVLDIL